MNEGNLNKIHQFGKELSAKINEGLSAQAIGSWASVVFPEFCYLHQIGELGDEIYHIVIDLMTMEEGPAYDIPHEELIILGNYLTVYPADGLSPVAIGWQLKILVQLKTDELQIERWAWEKFLDVQAEADKKGIKVDRELQAILDDLSCMTLATDDSGDTYTHEDLLILARLLMFDEKKIYQKWHDIVPERWRFLDKSPA